MQVINCRGKISSEEGKRKGKGGWGEAQNEGYFCKIPIIANNKFTTQVRNNAASLNMCVIYQIHGIN